MYNTFLSKHCPCEVQAGPQSIRTNLSFSLRTLEPQITESLSKLIPANVAAVVSVKVVKARLVSTHVGNASVVNEHISTMSGIVGVNLANLLDVLLVLLGTAFHVFFEIAHALLYFIFLLQP